MSNTIPLCDCGSCNDAHAAALKLYQQMLDSGDCVMWINAVTTSLVMMGRMGVAAKCMEVMKERGENILIGTREAENIATDIHKRMADLSVSGGPEQKAQADTVCAKYGEAIRPMAEDVRPIQPEEPNIMELLEKILGKDSVFTADSLGITKPH